MNARGRGRGTVVSYLLLQLPLICPFSSFPPVQRVLAQPAPTNVHGPSLWPVQQLRLKLGCPWFSPWTGSCFCIISLFVPFLFLMMGWFFCFFFEAAAVVFARGFSTRGLANLREAKHRAPKAHKYFWKNPICRGTGPNAFVIKRRLSVNAVTEWIYKVRRHQPYTASDDDPKADPARTSIPLPPPAIALAGPAQQPDAATL